MHSKITTLEIEDTLPNNTIINNPSSTNRNSNSNNTMTNGNTTRISSSPVVSEESESAASAAAASNNRRHHQRNSSWPRQGSRKGLIMALIVASVLILLVILTAVFVENRTVHNNPNQPYLQRTNVGAISLNDYLEGKYIAQRFNGTWISDEEIQYFNDIGDLTIYNTKDGLKTVILKAETMIENLNGYRPYECVFSADRRFILLGYSRQQIFRHSAVSKYEIYDVEMNEFISLVPSLSSAKQPAEIDRFHQLVIWSTVGNGIAFVHFNNVYYKESATSSEASQLTFDHPMNNNIFNGITDWVYEEEMFATSTALWFSQDGSNMAFVTFNDTEVEKITYPIYGSSEILLQFPYPHLENLYYPKSGRKNPTAKITLVSFNDKRLVTNEKGQQVNQYRMLKNLKFSDRPHEHYIGGATWATGSTLLVITLNRHQNDSRTHLCDMNGDCETILTTTISNGWIDVEVPKVSSDGEQFLTLTSQTQQLNRVQRGTSAIPNTYRHILQFSKDKVVNKAVTSGLFSVDSIEGWDETNGRIFFKAPGYNQSTQKAEPSQTHLWYADTNTDALICVTCDLRNSQSERCTSNSWDLSPNFSYFVESCSGGPFSAPEIAVRSINDPSSKLLSWNSNSRLRSRLAQLKLPTYEDYEIELPPNAENGENPYKIRARVFFPPNLVQGKKYPLLVDVYGGPGSQRVSDSYGIDWATTLVTSYSVIYASIDGRGSGRQSDDLKFQVYRRLGTVEVYDQISGGEWLIKNIPYVDPSRTAIWGWSYGGYATAMVMGLDSKKNVYKCGISVAPVTNWLLYDTIYTERYMGLPASYDNYDGYNKSDVTHYINNFRNKKFYIVHGNADDNVHYQQSMILSRALERADILFRQQSYPDETHGLSGVRAHLYHSLENFLFEECF